MTPHNGTRRAAAASGLDGLMPRKLYRRGKLKSVKRIAATALLAVASVVAVAGQDPTPQSPAQAAVATVSFKEWLNGVRDEALTRGIRVEIVDEALAGLEEPMPVVLERDRSQAEVVLPLETYVSRRLTRTIVRNARTKYAEHRTLLRQVSEKYGVPPQVIVAIWGIESNFGRFSGVRPTVPALATLAWDPRRSTFFRGELFDALEILNRGDITLPSLKGSWAGAMGQPQFMPSSYLRFAEDFDSDGRRDIWSSAPDVFASVANYLKGHGWTTGDRWGREVRLSGDLPQRVAAEIPRREGTCRATREMTVPVSLDDWQQKGVRLPGGGNLPKADRSASLVSGASRHFLVYGNYDVLLDYNCAHAYALSVGLLADAIGS
jgi:membrane-bound lytic murein transglycosylase B